MPLTWAGWALRLTVSTNELVLVVLWGEALTWPASMHYAPNLLMLGFVAFPLKSKSSFLIQLLVGSHGPRPPLIFGGIPKFLMTGT